MLAYDNIWLREPRLMVPRAAPIGRMRVDVRNSLANNIVAFVVAPPGAESNFVNLTGLQSYIYTAWTNRNTAAQDLWGNREIRATANSRDYYALPSYLPGTSGSSATQASLMAVFRPIATGPSNPSTLFTAHAYCGYSMTADGVGLAASMRSAVGNNCAGYVPVVLGTQYVALVSWRASDPNTLVFVVNNTEPTVTYTAQTTPTSLTGNGSGQVLGGGTNASDVAFTAGAIWARALSLGEMHALCRDPFQVLTPH